MNFIVCIRDQSECIDIFLSLICHAGVILKHFVK